MKKIVKEFWGKLGVLFLYGLGALGVFYIFMLFGASIICSVMLLIALLRGLPVEWYMIVAPIVFCLFVGSFVIANMND